MENFETGKCNPTSKFHKHAATKFISMSAVGESLKTKFLKCLSPSWLNTVNWTCDYIEEIGMDYLTINK